jgi:drug/metabolite transporter (DMT)-like permease
MTQQPNSSQNPRRGEPENFSFPATMAGAVICLGLVPLLEKLAVNAGSDLFSLVIAINLVTVVCLAGPAWRHRPDPLLLEWRSLLFIGAVASGIVVLLNLWALETTSATHRGVFQAMYPAATALFAFFILGERLPVKGYGVIAFMTIGIIIMSSQGMRWEFVFGDLLLMLTLPLMGICDAWAKRSIGTLSPEWTAFGRFLFGSLTLVALCVLRGTLPGWPAPEAWLWIVLSGFTISFGIILLYRGMELRGASLAAALVGLSPVLTLLLEWLYLDGYFAAVELLGMAMVLVGGYLLSLRDYQQPRQEPNQEPEQA